MTNPDGPNETPRLRSTACGTCGEVFVPVRRVCATSSSEEVKPRSLASHVRRYTDPGVRRPIVGAPRAPPSCTS